MTATRENAQMVRKSCKCPGCGTKVRVTIDGLMFEHKRSTLLKLNAAGTLLVRSGWIRCAWGGKPAPTGGEP